METEILEMESVERMGSFPIAAPADGPVPSVQTTASDLIFNPELFNALQAVAQVMASAKCTIPAHLSGSEGDCMAVVMQAAQWRMNPYSVAQKTHLIKGTLGYEAQLVTAVINSNAPIEHRLRYEWFGPWEKLMGKTKTMTGGSGKAYMVPDWDPKDEAGCGVRVWTTLRGDQDPSVLELLLVQAQVRNSTMWAADPKQQLAYLASKRWARLYCSDVIMGVYTPDELEQFDDPKEREVKGAVETVEPPAGASNADKLKAKIKGVAASDALVKRLLSDIRAMKTPDEAADIKRRTIEAELSDESRAEVQAAYTSRVQFLQAQGSDD